MTARQLWLLRHAKAAEGSPGMSDSDRPLSERGQHQASVLGRWMQQQSLQPATLLCSPAVRARQTAESVARELGIEVGRLEIEERLYLASSRALQAIIAQFETQPSPLMLVGHNPGLEELLVYLCGEPLPRTASGKLLTTANLVRIELSTAADELSAGSGRLLGLQRADEIA